MAHRLAKPTATSPKLATKVSFTMLWNIAKPPTRSVWQNLYSADNADHVIQAFEDGLYAELPCQKSNIDDDALDLNGKFKEVISMYNHQPSVGGASGSSGASSGSGSAHGKLKKILKGGGGEDVVKNVLGFQRLR
jgi:hypothetical protein